jgi:Ca2+-binding RTX toxin-like protein
MILEIDLEDTNGDGMASMLHRPGFPGFQRAYSFDGQSSTPAYDLGLTDIVAPGFYGFELTPTAGATSGAGTTSLFANFILSPGDTALVRGKFVQDTGTGEPECELPGLAFITGCSDPDAILGTEENDTLVGTPGDDIICGGDGNDRIDGMGGNDRLFGGWGRDSISGGAGRDLIHGGPGNDFLCGDAFVGTPGRSVGTDPTKCVRGGPGSANDEVNGDDGRDSIGGGPGGDQLHGGPGNDKMAGGAGRDRLYGEEGNDRLAGGDDDDRLEGTGGRDRLFGELGDDRLLANDGAKDRLIDGGDGEDSARIDSGVDPAPVGVETILP